MKKIFLITIFIVFNVHFSFASKTNAIDLSKKTWEYRWGDSAFEKNIPLWIDENEDASNWKEIAFPSNPPLRNGQTNVWYRIKLPDILTDDPTLYISSIDLISQVYLNGKQIYQFGDFDEQGKGEFQGWPWHMISLPSQSAGEYLYFRIYSDYSEIGLWGEIMISSEGQLFHKLLEDDIPKIMIGSVAVFVGVMFLLSFISRWKRLELFILGLLFVAQGADIIVSAKVLELYLYFPLLKQYVLASVFFFFPIGMALFMDYSIEKKVPFNLIRRIWQIHLLYFLGAILGALCGFFSIASTYDYFDILYNFFSLPILTIFMIYFFFTGDKETKMITFSFFIISLYWLYSYLLAHSLIPWINFPSEIAVFSCLLLLSYFVVSKLNYTEDLQIEKDKLEIISSVDYLTKLKNRNEIDKALEINYNSFERYDEVFSVILLDIDDFKHTNDTFGHLVGDEVLVSIAQILQNNTRETDFVGRWGGEEFLVICPHTNQDEVLVVAEKLRDQIEQKVFDRVGTKTASVGVSTSKKGDSLYNLLMKVDEAMYCAKKEGKNRVSYR